MLVKRQFSSNNDWRKTIYYQKLVVAKNGGIMEDLYIGKEFKTSVSSGLVIVKKLNNNNFECKCMCGNLLKVNSNDLISGKIKRCEECNNKIIIRHTHTPPIRLLCYIWEMYLYKYENPTPLFKKEIIKKNINFFTELLEANNSFNLFSQWALANNFIYETGNIYLDRKDKSKDFSMDNCFWTNEYKDETMVFIKSSDKEVKQ